MKVAAKIDLGRDFDKKLRTKIAELQTLATKPEAFSRKENDLILEIRRIARDAFKLGQSVENSDD